MHYLCSVFEAQFIVLLLNYKKMIKLVLSLAVIASMSFFACGSSEKQEEAPAVEEAVEVVEEVAVDTVAADTVAAPAAEEAPAAE